MARPVANPHWPGRALYFAGNDFMAAALHWFRRDFRIHDNTGLHAAAREHDGVAGVFVIDPRWLPAAAEKTGAFQAAFWLASLAELKKALAELDIPLHTPTDADPVGAILRLAGQIKADTITYNKDYEPDQITTDDRLERLGLAAGLAVRAYKDAVVWEEQEIVTGSGGIFSVFSPYKRAWLKKQAGLPVTIVPKPRRPTRPLPPSTDSLPTAESLGHRPATLPIATGETGGAEMLRTFRQTGLARYATDRNPPAVDGSSRLSAHLAAGTVSIRQCFNAALNATNAPGVRIGNVAGKNVSRRKAAESVEGIGDPAPDGPTAWIGELIWREFYRMTLFHCPETVREPFDRRYAGLTWSNDTHNFQAWKSGLTGYPIVDAAMGQLHATGWMHNRLRMITAMFLTKDLDVDWRKGERYFMQTLIDYDQANNVGGWQWSAGTGADAAPYFRVMNPVLQGQRFDPDGTFVRQYLPVLANVPTRFVHAPWLMPPDLAREAGCVTGRDYPKPIVDHQKAREKAIAKYAAIGRR